MIENIHVKAFGYSVADIKKSEVVVKIDVLHPLDFERIYSSKLF